MKYNVGDKVRIKSLDWYNENKNEYGNVNCPLYVFSPTMRQYCGTIRTIKRVDNFDKKYKMTEDGCHFDWTDEMIEGLAEEEVGLVDEFSSRWVNEFNLPEGYIFKDENGNVINATKIVLEKGNKYPKTYEECCKVLGVNPDNFLSIRNLYRDDGDEESTYYERDLLNKFDSLWQLLICRDAYWKIAGEEMGLGKPWEPDWKDDEQFKYIIICRRGCIIKDTYTAKDVILSFPTAEMRDAFYENFKELIEQCKELL